jgi:hypothetical protein
MIKKFHAQWLFKWFDFWVGLFYDTQAKELYIGLIPMLPIRIWSTEHKLCPDCGSIMHKSAYDTGDGWALFWDCEKESGIHCIDMDWPWPQDEYLTGKEIMRRGYILV